MTLSQRFAALCAILIAFAVPAYANNPPQPDGLFSVLLVFPVVILCARLAGVVPRPRRLSTRIIYGLAVAICAVFFLAAGTIVGMFAASLVLIYAVVRATQIMQRGQSTKRVLIGVLVMAFSLFAIVDYWQSIVSDHLSPEVYEYIATERLRGLALAEQEFAKSGQGNNSGAPTFGTVKELETAHLARSTPPAGQSVKGYRFGEILDADKKHYLFYAIPAPELKPADRFTGFVPGTSLFKSLFGGTGNKETGRYSFAVDDTGQIRHAVRATSGPVTREEVAQWQPLQ